MNNRLVLFAALAGAGMFTSSSSKAGSFNYEVVVTTTLAYGAMGSAYHSPNGAEFIGCKVSVNNQVSSQTYNIKCDAQDSTGFIQPNHYLSCTTSGGIGSQAEMFVRNLGAASSESFLEFQVGANGVCSNIFVANTSWAQPK